MEYVFAFMGLGFLWWLATRKRENQFAIIFCLAVGGMLLGSTVVYLGG